MPLSAPNAPLHTGMVVSAASQVMQGTGKGRFTHT